MAHLLAVVIQITARSRNGLGAMLPRSASVSLSTGSFSHWRAVLSPQSSSVSSGGPGHCARPVTASPICRTIAPPPTKSGPTSTRDTAPAQDPGQ
jgi:hypothetical protein